MRKNTIIIMAAVLIVGAAAIWYAVVLSGRSVPILATVERREVVQEVAFTGRLTAQDSVTLAFESAGTLASLNVKVGDVVQAGQEMARLDTRGVSLELAKARAEQAAATDKARLVWQDASAVADKTAQEGTRTLEQKRQTVRDAKKDMDQAQAVWAQAVREDGDEATTTKARYSTFLTAETAYRAAQKTLSTNEATISKTNVSARATTDEAYAAFLSTQQASPSTTGLSAGQAAQALANLRVVKSIALAPFDGVVTQAPLAVGEIATAGAPVITIETAAALEVVAQVPESDILKLKEDMEGLFTLDAFGDSRTFSARIIAIAPAAKILDGVPTYEVTFMMEPIEGARPGMTANVVVESVRREGVLAVPRRAVVRSGGQYKVRVADGEEVRETDVLLGIQGVDGYVEITEGLTEGMQIIVRE